MFSKSHLFNAPFTLLVARQKHVALYQCKRDLAHILYKNTKFVLRCNCANHCRPAQTLVNKLICIKEEQNCSLNNKGSRIHYNAMNEVAIVFAGLVVCLVMGITGVCGGSLMTRHLIFGFKIKSYSAIGTNLLFAAFTKIGGTVGLARHRLINWSVVGKMALGSVGACLAILFALQLLGHAEPAIQTIMTSTLGVALLLTAAATLNKVVRSKAVPTHIKPQLMGTSRNSDFRDEVPGVRSAAFGAYFTHVRMASTAQRSNSSKK